MAIMSYSPLPATTIADPVTFKEAVVLFARTGHPVHKNTLIRWAREKACPTERIGGVDYVSFTDLLEVHGEKFRARNA